jgi:Tfp pilus assembly protein PilF
MDAICWQELAALYEYRGMTQAAIKSLEKCLEKQREQGTVLAQYSTLIRLAHLQLPSKDYAATLEIIDQALDLLSYSPIALFMRGLIMLKQGDTTGAEDYFQRALMNDASVPLMNYYLSLVHFQVQELDLADSDLHYELDLYPLNDAALYQLGMYTRSMIVCYNSGTESPIQFLLYFDKSHNSIGRIAASAKKPAVAKTCLQKAIHLNPASDSYWRELDRMIKAK